MKVYLSTFDVQLGLHNVDLHNVNPIEHRTSTRKLSYTEDGLKESRNVCKYR